MKIRLFPRLAIALMLLDLAAGPAHSAEAVAHFTSAELQADLAELERALQEMPPDLARTADLARLEREFSNIESALADSPPLDREAAWRLFSTINPILGDGHLFVGFVDWRGDTRAHLGAGGVLFPFEMRVSPDCRLTVGAELGGRISPLTDATLRRVNGVDATTICEQMLSRVHGETRVFRAGLLSRRFFFYYWKVFGAPRTFDLEFDGRSNVQHLPGSSQLPQLLADEASFGRQFRLEFIGDETAAILTLGSFAWPDKQQVLDFTRDAFARLRAAGTKTLVIDLRDNGGGNDDVWIEGVMPGIARRPFRTGSTYRKRVVVANPQRHEVVGSVVDGEIDSWFPPQPDLAQRFPGKVYVAVGATTYSSAVVFCNVVQDFGFGIVAGPGGSVRANVSGGTRRTTLTHSGLIVVAPRFVLARPSGAKLPEWFTPDIDFDESRSLAELVGQDVLRETVGNPKR